MRIRHKVPSIFSLSMVDVLCCALGCVILVWLLNAKQSEDEAEERAEELAALRLRAEADHAESGRLLAASRAEYDKAGARLRQLLDERQKAAASALALEARIRDLEATRVSLEKGMASARADAADLAGKMKLSSARVAALEADLKDATGKGVAARKEGDAARASLAAMGKRHEAERVRADDLAKSLARSERRMDTTAKSLRDADRTRTALESALAKKDAEIKDLQAYKDRYGVSMRREVALDEKLKARLDELAAAERKIAALERGGKDSGVRVARLEKEFRDGLAAAETKVTKLEKERRALRLAAENRFAGITLTGKRVIFLVDTSGSMMMIDAKTDAPQKWQEVYTTVGKLIASMPDLEQFQVITFAKTTSFPLGSAGKWLRNDGAATAAKVEKTIASIKPSGGTNMYSALEAAFAYRIAGLDTIYLLSDGLPNQGEGLTAAERESLNEFDRSQKLGRYVLAKLKTDWNRRLAKSPRVHINTIGFFYESPDLGSFLWALARDNDGNFVGMSNP